MRLLRWCSQVLRRSFDRRRGVDRSSARTDPNDPTKWDVDSIRVEQSTGNGTFGDRKLG